MSESGAAPDQVVVRPATRSDAGTILGFVKELAKFEKEPVENVLLTEEKIIQDAFGERPRFEVLIAELTGNPIGMVLFFETYSTWAALPGIWIEELYVEERVRGQGIGSCLMSATAQTAEERGCGRVELAALNWNPAIEFYKDHGFSALDEWSIFRLDGQAISELASKR